MATLIINDQPYEIPDGSLIAEPCLNEGLTFNCNTGVCGDCQVTVLEGADQLADLTDEENDLGLDPTHRLACVCRIKTGTVKITF
jgi:ferredoxin